MRKVLGIALAMLFTLTVAAAAEELGDGRHSMVLDDGTKLTVSEKQISDLTPGEHVKAMFQADGSKNIVTHPDLRATNWGPEYGTQLDSIQAE